MTASKWQCPKGHLSWSPRKLEDCPHGGCGEKVECVAGPHRPKKQQEAAITAAHEVQGLQSSVRSGGRTT